jgi:ferritin-like metal-binding protein YciE
MSKPQAQIHEELVDWVGDIVALEGHVEEAMDHQLKLRSTPELETAIQALHDAVRDSKHRAVAFQESYGTTAGNPVIKAGGELLGKAAGLIDRVRNDSVSKALRDDYTAYNHLAISYTMLHISAMAFQDHAAMSFAEQGLRTYAGLVQDINHLMPAAVVADLMTDDHAPVIKPNVVSDCRAAIDAIWKQTNN